MPIVRSCTSCGARVTIPDAVDSRTALRCPKCHAEVPVPASHRVVVAEVVEDESAKFVATKKCSVCGERIRMEATRCKFCKTDLDRLARDREEEEDAEDDRQDYRPFDHTIHIFLTIFTCGAWGVWWLIFYLVHELGQARRGGRG